MFPGIRKIFLPCIFAICLLTVSAFYIKVPFGNWLFEKGLEAKKEWRLKEAVSYFKWSARLGVKTDLANFEEAYCHQLQGEYFRSQAQLEKLLANSIISQELKGRILNVNGRNLFNQNKSDKALESHEESLKIARLINNRKLEAESLVGLSRVLYHTKGKFDEARNNLDRALAIGKEINDELIIADALRNIGVVLWWGNGELDRPLEQFYKPALALYRKNGDLRSEATMLSNISFIYSFKGDGFQHIKLQNQALAIREKIGDRAGLSESYRAQGSAYLSVRNFKKAREFLVRSADIAKKIGFSLAQNEAETYLAGVLVELGEYDEAIRLFEQLLKRDKDSPVLAKSRLGSIANCHFLKGDYLKAREVFEQILEIELKSDLKDIRSISALYVYLGNTYLHLDRLDRAKEHIEKAEEMYEQHAAGLIRGHLLYNIVQADYRYRIGEFENSLQFLEDAAADELTLFASSGTSVVTSPFPRDYDRLFSLLLEKLSKKIGTEEGENNAAEELTFRFLEQRRYRSFRNMIVQSGSKKIASTLASENEKMALAEIEKIKNQLKNKNDHNLKNRLRRAYSDYENAVIKEQFSIEIQKAIATAHPVKLKTAQANLDEKTALIEYVFVGEKTIALVLTKDKLKSFPLTVTRSNLKNKTRILQTSVFSKDKNHRSDDWEPISRNLRESLIEPIERSGALKNKNRLAIIPFGFLHDLPFAMLTRNENGKTHFLIEDYVLFFPPSATFLTVNETKKETAKLVSFGRNSNDMADLPPLKFAVRESESVAEIFSGEAKLENKASETEFKDSAPKATHLHIAAHAIAEPEMPLFSRLLLKSTDKDDGKLTTREIFELGINANLVTIAACEGARSFSADSEGLIEIDRIGLTEAFLHAGSRSVLASLSPASDEATTELMQSFYKNLLSQDKATSLALAQREMLRREVNNRFTHPRYWANFVLIGTDR